MIKHGDWGWSSFCTNPHPTPLSTTRLLCWNLSPSSASGFGGTPGTFDSSVMWNSCNRIAEFLEILSRALSKQSQGRRQWKSKMHAICWNLAHICRILNVHWFRMATELRGAHANVAAHGHHDTIVVMGHRWVHLQTFSCGVQFFRILQTSALDCCTLTHLPRTKSADPCRQQGERVRGGLTSNKGRKEKIRRPLPTAGGAHQRRDYKQQVLCSASEGQVRGRTEREARRSARSMKKKKEARKEGQSQRQKQAKEARNKKLEARIKKQEFRSDKHEKGSEKGGAVPAKEASERSTKQEVRSKN